MTTTELADELVGGVLSAGPDRLEAAGELGLPQVVSLGALDMVNFGPARDASRRGSRAGNLYVHNPTITLMRTTPEECAGARAPASRRKLSAATGPVGPVRPAARRLDDRRRGPGLPRPGGRRGAASRRCARRSAPNVEVHELDADVNDPAFAPAMADRLHEMIEAAP